MNKPKTPFIVIIVGIILVIGGLVFVLKYQSFEGSFESKALKTSEMDFIDSDNDGLRDWEEALFKTDPLNPDSDGDGYLDGEEVDSGRNPMVKAPGDKLIFYPAPVGKKYNITQKVLTDEIIDSILDSYIIQKGEYIMDHPEINSPETFLAFTKESTIQEMSERALADSYSIILEKAEQAISEIPEIFDINITDKDIKISDNNSQEDINIYLNQVSSILNSDMFFLQEQVLQAVTSALKNNNFSELDILIKINDSDIEKAKEILVPSSWKEIHKDGLELTILLRNIFISFRDIKTDSLKAQIAIPELENFSETWNDLMKQAIDLANKQGIKLSL